MVPGRPARTLRSYACQPAKALEWFSQAARHHIRTPDDLKWRLLPLAIPLPNVPICRRRVSGRLSRCKRELRGLRPCVYARDFLDARAAPRRRARTARAAALPRGAECRRRTGIRLGATADRLSHDDHLYD